MSQNLPQCSGIVVHAGRGHHAQGVKLGAILVNRLAGFVLEFGKARNDTAAITEHPDRAALPVTLFGPVRSFELSQQIHDVIFILGKFFQAGHKTGPLTRLKLIEVRGIMHFLSHNNSPFSRVAWGLAAGKRFNDPAEAGTYNLSGLRRADGLSMSFGVLEYYDISPEPFHHP